jgi:RNA polymerase sigma factor (sigma-70 family)
MTESDLAPATDRDLLREYAHRRDGAAFALLVGRYGSFVYGVCRRVLGDGPDADDAFQATFIVLARKAGAVGRPDQLGGWLHAVAGRCARRARAAREGRRERERPMPDLPARFTDPDWADVRPVLDEEIEALPAKLRSALVLCELRGLDRTAAAVALGVPEGTLSSRLARGKDALRRRLVRRGVTLTALGVGMALADAARAAVPPGPVAATVAAVGGAGSVAAVSLAKAEVSAMFWTKAVKVGLAAAVLAAVGGGVVVGFRPTAAADDRQAKPDQELIRGAWVVTAAKKDGQDAPGKDQIGQRFGFGNDMMRFGVIGAKWKLDPSKDLKEIDLTVTVGPETEKGKVIRGLYKLDGDKLTLHLAHPGGDRPAGFDNKAGENSTLLTLERAPR